MMNAEFESRVGYKKYEKDSKKQIIEMDNEKETKK